MLLLLSSLLQYLELCPFSLQTLKDFYISQLHVSLNEYSNAPNFSKTVRYLIPVSLGHTRIAFL